MTILPRIETPADLRSLSQEELTELAGEIRAFIVESVTTTGGHLGSNLGVVELTLALHRVFESPRDAVLWDTGHQAYIHKLVTGRRYGFRSLRQKGGLSGYPNRAESDHDWIENSHASTVLSYAHGLASAWTLEGQLVGAGGDRRIVAVVGDGALTGGMAYEALNNLGHSGSRVLIVLNDNGRSYAPTVSLLSRGVTSLRLNPTYVQTRQRLRNMLRDLPAVGDLAYSGVHGLTSGLREVVSPHIFFETLGVRYAGPIDGHDVAQTEQALLHAAEWDGPIVVHVLTQKGRGYAPAEEDEVQCLHDVKATARPQSTTSPAQADAAPAQADAAPARVTTRPAAQFEPRDRTGAAGLSTGAASTYTDAFARALVRIAERRPEVVALTAAMPGPTGLLPFQARFPERFFDVGIAEQHEVTAAAGMAMGGLHPVVAVYSTFLSRAFDQMNLDVALHRLPVVFALDRAGITGDNGPSHHGIFDLVLSLCVPGMTVLAPSSAEDLEAMLETAIDLRGPVTIRYPSTPARHAEPGRGLDARLVRQGDGSVCLLGVGKLLAACEQAAEELEATGIDATLWDVRAVSPPDETMIADAVHHSLVVTAEDGLRTGGAGTFLSVAIARSADEAERAAPPVVSLGIPRAFLPQDKPDAILAELGLDGPGIAASVRQAARRGARELPGSPGAGQALFAP
ncbi:MAG: 1-deoxy-D-xylulose-5-phosphate synthase [Actinomycetota bacterium]|nr:1-deoxy-D-xylulose-5-phosphate synthase [Actinomycetota bacterium]